MDQYKALIEKANSGSQQDLPSLYQSLSKLEPVVKLVQKLEGKSEVNFQTILEVWWFKKTIYRKLVSFSICVLKLAA